MKKIISIIFAWVCITVSAQTYNDARMFDAKGAISSIDYRTQAFLPTSILHFSEDGAISKILQQEALNDSVIIKTDMPIAEIVRNESNYPVAIKFKTMVPVEFVVKIKWHNDVAQEFQYKLIYDTKYVKVTNDEGVTTALKLYADMGKSDDLVYGGECQFHDYEYDSHGNWIQRTATIYDENGNEGESYTEERIITYYQQ
ncbi:MAG: hypothetical protein K2M11_09405 [Paramuribaculum sp.]|nr:hypothetical protein [Paramuribaculum sp.]